jgi:streptomycin 6-kinase
MTLESWQQSVPQLVQSCSTDWGLELGEAFPAGAGGFAAPARLSDGSQAVIKIAFPHRESEYEADALAHWSGDGAVRLLKSNPTNHAMLIERCDPGTPLSQSDPDEAMTVLADLLPRLWKPAAQPFRTLAAEAAWWRTKLKSNWERFGKPFERKLLDVAMESLTVLPTSQGEQVLLHQDLHGDNILRAKREPWLVIDPKPLVGEREFALAPIVRSFEFGHSRQAALMRLDRLSSELGLNRDRARLWTIAQTIAWSFDSKYHATHTETARWLM